MKSIFYGKKLITNYKPRKKRNPYDYSIVMYDIDREIKSDTWHPFYEKDFSFDGLKEGDKIQIDGENLYIKDFVKDIKTGNMLYYTSKIISETTAGMSKEEAERELKAIKKYDKSFIGRIKELKYQF